MAACPRFLTAIVMSESTLAELRLSVPRADVPIGGLGLAGIAVYVSEWIEDHCYLEKYSDGSLRKVVMGEPKRIPFVAKARRRIRNETIRQRLRRRHQRALRSLNRRPDPPKPAG